MPGFLNHVQDNKFAYASITSGAGFGLASAIGQFKRDKDLNTQDRFEHTGMAGMRGVAGGLVLAGLGGLGYHYQGPLKEAGKTAGGFVNRQVQNVYKQTTNDQWLLQQLVPRDAAHEAILRSRGVTPLTHNQAFIRSVMGNGRLLMGAGAVAGAAIGTANGADPITGAAIGATVGLGARMAYGATNTWKAAGKVPLLRSAGVAGLSAMVFMGVQAMAPKAFAGEAAALPDGMGGYEYGDPGEINRRMSTLGATGDLVLGLNNARHGR